MKYIFGHKNPDTDSICSSIAYENLKKELGDSRVEAVRLGNINKETEYVLKYFGVDIPKRLKNVNPQVSDLAYYDTVPIYKSYSIKKVWDIMEKSGRNVLPIVNNKNMIEGMVSISNIAMADFTYDDKYALKNHYTDFKNILEVLGGEIISGEYAYDKVNGSVYIDSGLDDNARFSDGDIVITGQTKRLAKLVFESGAGCVIITENKEPSIIPYTIPKYKKCVVIRVKFNFFKTIKIINQSIPISSVMKKKNIVYFYEDEYVKDIKDSIKDSKYRNFPILYKDGSVKGIISRRHLIDYNRKKVILVDHNEKSQSIEGIDNADIVEIIDHHRVADILTLNPLYFRAEPVGCTSTIITKMYKENNIKPSKKIAGIMLSAILSDTLLFKSPTCTREDVDIAHYLEGIAGVSINDYGMDMIIEGTSLEGKSAYDIFNADLKKFIIGDYKIAISQINTADYKTIYRKLDDIKNIMENICVEQEYSLIIFMITNVVVGGSELVWVGKEKDIMERAFDIDIECDSFFLKGVLSRKKQVLPRLMNACQL